MLKRRPDVFIRYLYGRQKDGDDDGADDKRGQPASAIATANNSYSATHKNAGRVCVYTRGNLKREKKKKKMLRALVCVYKPTAVREKSSRKRVCYYYYSREETVYSISPKWAVIHGA